MALQQEVTVKLKGDGRHLTNTLANVNKNVTKQMGALQQGIIGKARSGLMGAGSMGSIGGFGAIAVGMEAAKLSFNKLVTSYDSINAKLDTIAKKRAALTKKMNAMPVVQLQNMGMISNVPVPHSIKRQQVRLAKLKQGYGARRMGMLLRTGGAVGIMAGAAGLAYGQSKYQENAAAAGEMGMGVREYTRGKNAFGDKLGGLNSSAESNAISALNGSKDKQEAFSKAGISTDDLKSMRGIDIITKTMAAFGEGAITLSDAMEILGDDAALLATDFNKTNEAFTKSSDSMVEMQKHVSSAIEGLKVVGEMFAWLGNKLYNLTAMGANFAGMFIGKLAKLFGAKSWGTGMEQAGREELMKQFNMLKGTYKGTDEEAAEQAKQREVRAAKVAAAQKEATKQKASNYQGVNLFDNKNAGGSGSGLNAMGIYSGGKGLFESLMQKQVNLLDKVNYNLRKIDDSLNG